MFLPVTPDAIVEHIVFGMSPYPFRYTRDMHVVIGLDGGRGTADLVLRLRTDAGLTQAELASRMGTSSQWFALGIGERTNLVCPRCAVWPPAAATDST